MSRNASSEELRQALPLLEEAATLLRHAPPRAWACYVAGTGPFVLGVVWFWSAMCNLSTAQAPAPLWALPLAALHLWMRVWQSRFAALLSDLRGGRAPEPWTAAAWARAAANQLRHGVPAFLALLPALLVTLPFGWVYAYYHTLAVTAHRPDAAARAWKTARHAPYQNHAALAWLLLCGTVAFVNVFTVVWVAPGLVKLFVPVEWTFTRYPFWILNSTALCVMAALTYLATDPLVKAVYVLRAFYGLSRATGEDLLADWRRLRAAAGAALALLLLAAAPLAAAPAGVLAAVPSEAFAPASGALPPGALDERIDRALRHPRYDWRLPLESAPADNWPARQLRRLTDTLSRWTRGVFHALRRFSDWLKRLFSRDDPEPASRSPLSAERLSAFLTAALLAAAAFLLFLLWRGRGRKPESLAAAAAAPRPAAPDVADETVTADVLPDDEWLRLADRLRAGGEYRKAARALFLGLLACLARRGLLSLSTSKSTADYLRELRRRTAGHPFDEAPFRQAAGLFEAGWYGDHPVTEETLNVLTGNVEGYRHG
jgi:hypothetical protein